MLQAMYSKFRIVIAFSLFTVCLAVDSTPGHTTSYSLSSACPSKIGPTHGAVLRWFRSSNESNAAVPTNKINCWITLKGQSEVTTTNDYAVGVPQMVTSFKFRIFKIKGWNTDVDVEYGTCTTAYVEVFNADDVTNVAIRPAVYRSCGTTKPAEFVSTSTTIKFHLVIGTNPGHNSSALPDIDFVADFTTFFIGNCSDDPSLLTCNNSRCIDSSLACDNNRAQNCGDGSDESIEEPAFCPVPEPPFVLDEVALYSVLGAVALLSSLPVLYWCCWRPGWFPWRVSRCRQCCRDSYGRRPLTSAETERESRLQSVYGGDGGGGCCGGCLGGGRGATGGSSSGGSSFGKGGLPGKGGGSLFVVGGNGLFGGGQAAEPWWEYAQQDGGHLRECR